MKIYAIVINPLLEEDHSKTSNIMSFGFASKTCTRGLSSNAPPTRIKEVFLKAEDIRFSFTQYEISNFLQNQNINLKWTIEPHTLFELEIELNDQEQWLVTHLNNATFRPFNSIFTEYRKINMDLKNSEIPRLITSQNCLGDTGKKLFEEIEKVNERQIYLSNLHTFFLENKKLESNPERKNFPKDIVSLIFNIANEVEYSSSGRNLR